MNLTYSLGITLLVLAMALVACIDDGKDPVSHSDVTPQSLNVGYDILRDTLRDEQHLKTIRYTKTIVTFKSISEDTEQVIDDIAQTSAVALKELEQLASLTPRIIFDINGAGQIEQMTRDALRITTAKEFLTSKEDFEVRLIVSQTQALRFISHVTKELSDIETNTKRKEWLGMISGQFEILYVRVLSRLKVA